MPASIPAIGISLQSGEYDVDGYLALAKATGYGEARVFERGQEPPRGLSALILLGNPDSPPDGRSAEPLAAIVNAGDTPVLGIGSGMRALNLIAGGSTGSPQEPIQENEEPQRLFITLGSKLAHIIGGSGWVKVPGGPPSGMTHFQLANNLMASCYSEQGDVYGLEARGHRWLLGTHWDPLSEGLPGGFSSLANVFMEHAYNRYSRS